MIIECVIAVFTSFILTALMGPHFIPLLHRMKFGQEVRDDGPRAHLKKQGTPTMGGIMFLISIVLTVLIFMLRSGFDTDTLLVLLLTAGFGLIGFADDFLKIKKHQSEGLNPKQKLLLQLVLTLVFAVLVYRYSGNGGSIYIPFLGVGANAPVLTLPFWIFVPFVLFVVLGTDNGVNFTDGLDGLCSSVTTAAAAFFAVGGLLLSSGMSIVAAAVIGALLGFLIYNLYPAKVFMGDTGSLALGGFIAGAAVVSGLTLYIPIVGFIYMIEVISVIIQVAYFKKTHGKRFFKMAPIHHHFELLGNSETRIVGVFTGVTILLSLLGLVGMIA
ncbi:MAG: phospho-N-acetylmuramoyl-pentapeptide-transferase [Eubacteriales bacterium]|nr:phospho-N-acetylmuramoyl-pentapeptide-transferase [Eubacteriales bacterium]